MKKIITLALAMALLCCCLAGCGGPQVDLTGRWESVFYYDADSVIAEFEAMEFYDEEIALLDAEAMGICEVLLLNEDLSYTMTCDAAKSRDMVEAYYRDAFAVFYENREQLQDLYDEDFAAMSEAEFNQFYAELYGAADFDALIDLVVGTVEDYAYLEEEPETGTFRISMNRIYFTIDGTNTEEYVTFTVAENGSLSLEYTDSTVTYTKAE
ncbi:MAG: hypothetical protein IJZ39_10775 [Oscillospiraceae bacterium]|nr:hypothetical protein [Oscillospiraceae bacterium]